MHRIDYTWDDYVWGKRQCLWSLFSLFGLCAVMGIHVRIALVDWIGVMIKVLWHINELDSKYEMLICLYYDGTL